MKIAVSFRGLCMISSLDSKDLISYETNFIDNFENIKNNIFDCNENVIFDIYGFGWVDDIKLKDHIIKLFESITNVNVINIELAHQRNFKNEYIHIKDHSNLLTNIYQYQSEKLNYLNLDLRSFFQNQYSYAYGISKVSEMINTHIDYDFFISMRWDCSFEQQINFQSFDKTKIYVNFQPQHSPIFVGDFFSICNRNIFKHFYLLIKSTYENDHISILQWKQIICKHTKNNFNKNISCYANQCFYAYYLYLNHYDYLNIDHSIKCKISKTQTQKHINSSNKQEKIHLYKPIIIENTVYCHVIFNNQSFTFENTYYCNKKPFTNLNDRVESFISLLIPHVIFCECELIVYNCTICPQYLENINKMASFYESKLGNKKYNFKISFQNNFIDFNRTSNPSSKPQKMCCFSGGVDSFCTLLSNFDDISAIFYGINYDVYTSQKKLLHEQLDTVYKIGEKYKKDVYLCDSNFKMFLHSYSTYKYLHKEKDYDKWLLTHVPCKVSNFYNLSNTFDTFMLSSWNKYDIIDHSKKMCLDSNKIVDELFNCSDFNIIHDGDLSRFEKIKKCISIDKETFFQYLKVCWKNPNQEYNCSKCEKCIVTMIFIGLVNSAYLNELSTFKIKENNLPQLIKQFCSKNINDNYNIYKQDIISILKNV